jgi:hypothetical protein
MSLARIPTILIIAIESKSHIFLSTQILPQTKPSHLISLSHSPHSTRFPFSPRILLPYSSRPRKTSYAPTAKYFLVDQPPSAEEVEKWKPHLSVCVGIEKRREKK